MQNEWRKREVSQRVQALHLSAKFQSKNQFILLSYITFKRDTVRPYAEDLVRKRIKVLSESPNAFLILKVEEILK